MATYRILSLDGGGIRGVLTAVLLQRLEERFPELIANADLIAGTSTGGILALGLAAGKTPQEIRELYRDNCDKIFDDSWLDDLFDLGRLTGAEYDNENLEKVIRSVVGNKLLKELGKTVLIAAFDLDSGKREKLPRTWNAKFFHNFEVKEYESSDGDCEAAKVALYTSAAPTYFPSVDGYIDGGVVANNPSMAALAQPFDKRVQIDDRPELEDIALLSVGTGTPPHFIEGGPHDWGYAQWAKPIIDVMLEGGMGVADFQCQQFLGDRYIRISPMLKKPIGIDACNRVGVLEQIGEDAELDEVETWLKDHWQDED